MLFKKLAPVFFSIFVTTSVSLSYADERLADIGLAVITVKKEIVIPPNVRAFNLRDGEARGLKTGADHAVYGRSPMCTFYLYSTFSTSTALQVGRTIRLNGKNRFIPEPENYPIVVKDSTALGVEDIAIDAIRCWNSSSFSDLETALGDAMKTTRDEPRAI